MVDLIGKSYCLRLLEIDRRHKLKFSEGYLRSFFCVQSKWDAESYGQANSSNCSLPSYLGILIDMAFGEPFLAPVFGSSKEGPL